MHIGFSVLLCLTACASGSQGGTATQAEPTIHDYRTGSLLAQKERRSTTPEEREQAQKAADDIRRAGGGFGTVPNR